MAILTPDQLREIVGYPPNTGNSADISRIETAIRAKFGVRGTVEQYLATQGLPSDALRRALPASLAKAYVNSIYLRAWRNKSNPAFDLLDLGNGDDNDGESKEQAPPPISLASIPQAVIDAAVRGVLAQANRAIEAKIASAKLSLDPAAKAQIRALATSAAQVRIDALARPQVIEIHNKERGEIRSIGLQHERFPTLLRAMQARDHRGFRLNIWLTGPTGSGKTSACEAAAKALDLPFGSDGSLDADYKVLGFRDANGNIISTQFLTIYENGGIYVADEIDNWLPSALLSLNAALANGFVSSPKGMIQRHPDACVIACANTWGFGATNDYVGRTRLDAASLDRFQPKISWPYDAKLEHAVAEQMGGTVGLDWHATVTFARSIAANQGLKIIISPRATFSGIALLQAGFAREEVIDMTICAGLSPDQRQTILNGLTADASAARRA